MRAGNKCGQWPCELERIVWVTLDEDACPAGVSLHQWLADVARGCVSDSGNTNADD